VRTTRVALRPAAAVLLALCACATSNEVDPRYAPTQNVLEVVAVLRRHVPDDTYRFPPAQDFTDRNVYRSSLLRLESIERVHAEALRAGHMDGVIAFAKGRALERLRAYDLAAAEYRLAAEFDASLAAEAHRSADVCDELHEVASLPVDTGPNAGVASNPDAALDRYDERVTKLDEVLATVEGTHYTAVVREEVEQADMERARYFVSMRRALPEGDVRALAEAQRVLTRHRESKNANRQILALANLYADLAVEYVDEHSPEGLFFDPVRFQELIDAAARLYETVANRDGTPEKLEAARRLEAFLAFALRIDRDRFTP
jgi:tetratricopeptide (TPR) repeat protein